MKKNLLSRQTPFLISLVLLALLGLSLVDCTERYPESSLIAFKLINVPTDTPISFLCGGWSDWYMDTNVESDRVNVSYRDSYDGAWILISIIPGRNELIFRHAGATHTYTLTEVSGEKSVQALSPSWSLRKMPGKQEDVQIIDVYHKTKQNDVETRYLRLAKQGNAVQFIGCDPTDKAIRKITW